MNAKKIVAVGAHLDDIELGCGATLAKYAAGGSEVLMICLTHSAYVNHDGTVLRTEQQAIEEGQAAAEALGAKLDLLDFSTKDLPYDSTTVEALDSRFVAFGPALIFTMWPHDTHQAHRATAMATISAARRHNSILMYEPIFPAARSYTPFRPQIYVDVGDYHLVKEESLRAHTSQWEKYGDQWLDGVRARSRLRGYEMEREHAEAFEVVRYELEVTATPPG